MCVIIDVNVAGLVFRESPDPNFLPVFHWLHDANKDGRIVYGGQLARELIGNENVRRFLLALQRAGRASSFPEHVIQNESVKVVEFGICRSNDIHIIALARVSGARTLCSSDQDLHADFKNRQLISEPRGHVYQRNTKTHRKFLRHTSSCKMGLRKYAIKQH